MTYSTIQIVAVAVAVAIVGVMVVLLCLKKFRASPRGNLDDGRGCAVPATQGDCYAFTLDVTGQTGGECTELENTAIAGDVDPEVLRRCRITSVAQAGGKAQKVTNYGIRNTAGERDKGDPMARYTMQTDPRGICLIMNNTVFAGTTSRYSCQQETEQLRSLFSIFKFNIRVEENRTADEMLNIMREVSSIDHGNHDCFVCFFLSHGREGQLLGSDGKTVPLGQLISMVKPRYCPSLKDKPKVIFVEACRTANQDYKDEFLEIYKVLYDDEEPRPSDEVPKEKDFFIGYATVPDEPSLRSFETGDWYTHEVINALKEKAANEDLLSIMTDVNRRVEERKLWDKEGNIRTQFPGMLTYLTRKLYFQ